MGLKPHQQESLYRQIINVISEEYKDIEIITVVLYRPLFSRYLSSNMQRLKGYHQIKVYKQGSTVRTPSKLDHLQKISDKLKIIPLEHISSETCLQKEFFNSCGINLSPNSMEIFDSIPS